MNDVEFGRVLNGGAEVVPSSGFVGAVMDAVRREATLPPPIPFPWARVWPAFAAVAVAVAWTAIAASSDTVARSTEPLLSLQWVVSLPALSMPSLPGRLVGPAFLALSLALAFVCFRFAMRLTGNRS